MATAWAHLPNAALIDAVRADVKARPDVWEEAWRFVRTTQPGARAAAIDATWHEAKGTIRDATRGTTSYTAWDALLALITWDDCAHLLGLPSDTLRTMIDLCDAPVCHQAVLLLPYVLVKEAGQ